MHIKYQRTFLLNHQNIPNQFIKKFVVFTKSRNHVYQENKSYKVKGLFLAIEASICKKIKEWFS